MKKTWIKLPRIGVGHRFGRLVVTGHAGFRKVGSAGRSRSVWACLCDCGTSKNILSSELRYGHTKSCGCLWRTKLKGIRGEKHPSWCGGKTITSKGYIMVHSPEHPAAQLSGYVPEHRLVMEKRIGRFLFPDETVHHKNGNRQDNRDENLELWAANHPVGQKVEDMLMWAKEILKRYDAGASSMVGGEPDGE